MAKSPRPKKITPDLIEEFLGHLRDMPNVARACRLCNISTKSMYNLRQKDEQFSDDWDLACKDGVQKLEEIAWSRAEDKSDLLTIFLLKAHDKKYSDKLDLTSGDKPIKPPTIINVILPPVTPEES